MKARWRAVWWSLPFLWWVVVMGTGYRTADQPAEEGRWLRGERGLVRSLRLYFSSDHDEHLYFEYAGYLLGANNVDAGLVAERHRRPLADYPRPDGRPKIPYVELPVEYPPLALAPMVLARLATDDLDLYRHLFAVLMTAFFYCALLAAWRVERKLGAPANRAVAERTYLRWVLASAVGIGIIAVTRIDAVPAALVMVGLALLLHDRPVAAGVCFGLGIATKLWPALVFPLALAWLFARGRTRDAARAALAGSLVALLVHLPFVLIDPGRALAAYTYHADRGLHIESFAAGLLMLAHLAGMTQARAVEAFGACELATSWSAPVARALRYLTPLAVVATTINGYLEFRRALERGAGEPELGRLLLRQTTGAVAAILCLSHVLSPQYLVWIFPLALVVEAGGGRVAGLYVALVAATQVVFPRLYSQLKALHPAMIAVLVVRNLGIAFLAYLTLRRRRVDSGRAQKKPRPS